MENDPHDSASLEAEMATMEEDQVTVSVGPMGPLFRQLRSAIAWQHGRLKGVQAEIKILGEGLVGLCTDLKDLSEGEDTITRCWVSQVREICYDTSDYLDELMHFIHDTPQNRLGSKIFRFSRRLRLSLPKVKKLKRVALIAKLSALVARVEDADERRKRFKISPPQASRKLDSPQVVIDSHLMHQLPLQLHVDKLTKLLGFHHNNERNLKVVTIFGSVNVDKTVVARTLYHKYRGRFEFHAFLRVSRDPDIRRLLADMLSQIKAPPASAFCDVEGLIATITEYLQRKSYFIIIDDLWDTSTWDIIRYALPDGDSCRIITTTQIEDVARACCNDQLKHIYKITPHNDDQSRKSQDGVTTYHNTEGMKNALNLVYNNLPPHLQTCLLYLNIYPEGWTVKKGELVKQWIVEGFIRSVEGQDADETAGCYFDALVSRGMLQSVDTNHKDEVLSCTLHHMVLDLIRQKSMEENFVTIVNYFHTIIGLPDKVRRLSVQMGGAKGANNISGNMRIPQVRSLMFCGFFKSVPSIMDYGLLQVLILHIWSDQDGILDLTKIGDLYRLRYLKIDCSITVKLPPRIRRLQQLGTLQVDARLYAVPSDIVYLEKLLHLCLRSESILPHGVGRMTRLRTLGSFDLGNNSEDNVRDLAELENLQDLQLTCSAVQQAESLEKNVQLFLGSVLRKLSMLQSVTLVPAAGPYNDTLQDGSGASRMCISSDGSNIMSPAPAYLRRLEFSRHCCIFSRFPKWLGDLAKLCILKIAVGELSKEDIVILNGLPALASLSLHVAPRSTEKKIFGKQGFSVLRYFKFTCTAPWLEFEAGAMPNLERLKLCFNSPVVDEQGTPRTIIIGRLLGLKEFSAIIGSAGVDAESAWWKVIRNDPRNPKVQLMSYSYYGEKGMVTREGSGEHRYNEADIRIADSAREESDEDVKENSDSESASAFSSYPHPDTKQEPSISREANTAVLVIPPSTGSTVASSLSAISISSHMRSVGTHYLESKATTSNRSPRQDLKRSRSDMTQHPSREVSGTQSQLFEHLELNTNGRPTRTPLSSMDSWDEYRRTSQGSRYNLSRNDNAISVSGSAMPLPMHKSDDGHFSPPHEIESLGAYNINYDRFEEALRECQESMKEVLEESTKCRKAELDPLSALQKAKELEKLYHYEVRQRVRQTREMEETKIQCGTIYNELHDAEVEKVMLEQRITEMNSDLEDHRLKLARSKYLLEELQEDKEKLQQERDAAVTAAEELRQKNEQRLSMRAEALNTEFSASELVQATRHFDESLKIGEGGFGCVYKGSLRSTTVAIKLLHPESLQGQSEFHQQVAVLSRVRHPNLVMLIGSCREAFGLVYEFLPNGSLEERLTCTNNTPPLTWQVRTRIIAEMCSVLTFLHSNKPHPVVHGDLRPANILLDANLVSKLGDLGISTTTSRGTFAYMDPEFMSTGELTPRSDVYSFGIIILQLLTGRSPQKIAEVVEDAMVKGDLPSIVDPSAGSWPFLQANQLAHLGLGCAERSRRRRPDLAEVWMVVKPLMKASSMMVRRPMFAANPMMKAATSSDDASTPSYFLCPIFQEMMGDPHIAADGFTYEAEAIRGWLDSGHDTSPMTNLKLAHLELTPNRNLRSVILEWQHQRHLYHKDCVALETRHTNTSSCTRGAGGDTPQLAPREACFQRDTQDSKQALFRPDAPAPREAPSEEAGDDWLN